MYAGVAQAIIKELKDKGFEAKQLGSGVVVSLNRPISQMEVETVLEEAFDGIKFQLRVADSGIFIEL